MEKLEKFIFAIESDIAWRKKEVSNIMLMHDADNSELIVKSSILLIYSHWEGCIKNMCKKYLSYVSKLSLNLTDLTDNFKAIALKGRIGELVNTHQSLTMVKELDFLKLLADDSEKKFRVKSRFEESEKDKSVINTTDNLSYEIFSSFLKIVGIGERACLASKEVYIDEKLLLSRNKIAHGSKINNDYDDFELDIESVKEIKNLIFLIIDFLSEDLKYYAENQYYLAKKEPESQHYNIKSNDRLEKRVKALCLR